MYDFEWQKKINSHAKAERRAREILGVDENASPRELKRAWRSKCKEHHPDRQQDDAGAEKRFKLARQAYLCLRYGKRCDELAPKSTEQSPAESEDESSPSNRWAYFLSWRDRFF